jgi:phage gp29-like protein
LMIARGDAAQVGGTLVRDLVRPMVQMNFGPNAPVPRFRFAVDPAQDLDAVAKRLFGFVDHGGELAQADARNLLNLPDPSPNATLMQPEKIAGSGAPVVATPKNTSQ